MPSLLANHHHHLGLVVERVGDLRPHQRLTLRDERSLAPHEDGRKLRNVVALKAFLHMLQIVQAEADALRWPRHRQAELEPLERHAGARWRLLGEIGKRLEIAPRLRQHVGQIDRQPGIGRLQVDHIVALDHAQAQPLVTLKP